MKQFDSIPLTHEAQIGLARRNIHRTAVELGFNELQLAEIEIVVKELGTNALKFARGTGRFYYACADEALEPRGIEIIYLDKGPGIEDTAMAISDGYSTTGSLGAGLGSVKRMSDEFYIYSALDSATRRLPLYGRTTHGTAIIFRKRVNREDEAPQAVPGLWGAMTRPAEGHIQNGDAYLIRSEGNRLLLAMIDGLGHGEAASDSARAAVATIERNLTQPIETILRATHDALRMMRGAVMGLAAIDRAAGIIEYAGIGNTDFRVIGGRERLRFISLNGTLGSRLERVKVFKENLPKVSTMIMATDGISERWDTDNYPGLMGLHPQLLCATVMRDFSRPNDDATILCGRLRL
jgi:anti-sigma regulatory factor (Ser/Thr protein kinase)